MSPADLESSKTEQPSDINLRALTNEEIKQLEDALVKPVDRNYLVHWVSQATREVVRLSTNQASLGDCREDVLRIIRDGRKWLEHIAASPAELFLRQGTELDQVTGAVARFCDSAEAVAEHIDTGIKPGHPPTPFPLKAFLENMIGIAKMAKVRPSTPSRAFALRSPPAFFNFTKAALSIARQVIRSSPLPEDQRDAALLILRARSDEALIKILEELRGHVRDYREGPYGLVEWQPPSDGKDG